MFSTTTARKNFRQSKTEGQTLLLNPDVDEMSQRGFDNLSRTDAETQNTNHPQSESSFSIHTYKVARERVFSSDFNDDHYLREGTADGSRAYRNFDAIHSKDKLSYGKGGATQPNSHDENDGKMGTFGTFFAIIKAYCAINVLLLPRSFANGGYLLSPLAMIFACVFETMCAVRLTTVAQQYQIFDYPLLMKRAIGDKGLHAARICLALAHFQFTIGQVTFTLKSLQSTLGAWFGYTTPLWVFGIGIWFIYTPLVWVRKMESFKQAFIFAVMMILLGVLTTSTFAVQQIEEQQGSGPDFVSVNQDSYWSMIGFAFFMFEGIGCLMPIMRETRKPEQLPLITAAAIVTLCTIYIFFSLLCYYTWGSDLTQPVVTEMLPAENHFVQAMKLLFCVNLFFSYPLTIVPSFNTLEAYVLGKKETISEDNDESDTNTADSSGDQIMGSANTTGTEILNNEAESQNRTIAGESVAMYWKVNILRSFLVLVTVIIVIFVAEKLDKVMSIAGAIFGMTNVLLLPTICHLKLSAKTTCSRIFDHCIIIFAIVMLIFGPFTIVMQWRQSAE